jgi:hypothetical protein
LPWSPRIEQAMQILGQLCKRQLAKTYLASEVPVSNTSNQQVDGVTAR